MHAELSFVGTLASFLDVLPHALAAPLPTSDPCTYIGGGYCTTASAVEEMLDTGIKAFGNFFIVGAGAYAVLATAIGGFQMLLSYGDEGRFNKGRESITWGLIGFGLCLAAQVIVNFVGLRAASVANDPKVLQGVQQQVMDAILTLLNISFILIVIAAGIRAIIGRGKGEEFTAAKKALGYAIAGAIIVNLARALAYAALHLFG